MNITAWLSTFTACVLMGACVHSKALSASQLADLPPTARAISQLKHDLILSTKQVDTQIKAPGLSCDSPAAAACDFGQNLQLSHVMDGAYTILMLKDDPELQAELGVDAAGAVARAQCWLQCAFAFQDLTGPATADPKSTYGRFAWNVRRTVTDDNAIEFAAEGLSRLAAQFRSLLSPTFQQQSLIPHLKATLTALQRHIGPYGANNRSPVPMAYTNIFLGNIVAQILLSETLAQPGDTQAAYALLDRWLANLVTNGIEEYDSPFYGQLDLSALEMGHLLAGRKADFADALAYFWADFAANTFHGELSGSHSRNYDFLRSSSGGLALNLFVAGLRPAQRTAGVDLSKIFVIAPRFFDGYQPTVPTLALAQQTPRWIRTRIGGLTVEDYVHPVDRSNYITSAYALGSSSQDYTKKAVGADDKVATSYMDQDRIFSLQFADSALPDVSLNINTSVAAVYGAATADASGHIKTHHVAPVYPTIVQAQDSLLVMLNLNPSAYAQGSTPSLEYTTNLVLPYQLSLSAGGDQLQFLDRQQDWQNVTWTPPPSSQAISAVVPVPRLATVAGWASSAHACFGARFFHVDTTADASAEWFALRAETVEATDDDGKPKTFGWRQGAVRLALSQYRSSAPRSSLKTGHALVGLVFSARICANATDFAKLKAELAAIQVVETSGSLWTAQATWPSGLTLTGAADINARTTVSRRVNDVEVQAPAGLEVNGVQIAPSFPYSW